MEIIYMGRGCGKTMELIKRSSENNIPILVYCSSEKFRIMEKAKTYGYKIPNPIVYSESSLKGVGEVYVDNAEMFLQSVVGTKLAGITISCD